MFDEYLRKRAAEKGAKLVNGLMMRMEQKGARGGAGAGGPGEDCAAVEGSAAA